MIPLQPGKKLVIFVDDINMPSVEQYGSQPPIELMRQIKDSKGIFDRKMLFWKEIKKTILIVAGSPPGGGRSAVTPRFTRHFTVLNVPNATEDTLAMIFSQIFKGFLKLNNFRPEIQEIGENSNLVNATISLYTKISLDLLPTPMKSHYVFNLRDVAKVF